MKKVFLVSLSIILILIIGIFIYLKNQGTSFPEDLFAEEDSKINNINNFEECAAAGNRVMESYPRECRTQDGKSFTEDIGNELLKSDLIIIESPRPNEKIESPVKIIGMARGYWFFEGSFPIKLTDKNGNILAYTIAKADGEWMTEEFVRFSAELIFPNISVKNGNLILEKDNPSGLPEYNDALIVPVVFDYKEF
jgi:hypothetical protein